MLVQRVPVSLRAKYGPENTSIRGSRIPPLERVFNKMVLSTQSLYARARIGIVR